MPEYEIAMRNPTVAEYCALRAGAGLSPRSEEIVRLALPNTLFAVVVEHRGSAVGMGRVVGDGGTVFQVADIAVLPEHQGRGLGKQILDAIDAWLRQTAVPEPSSISLRTVASPRCMPGTASARAKLTSRGCVTWWNKSDRCLSESSAPAIAIRTLAGNKS